MQHWMLVSLLRPAKSSETSNVMDLTPFFKLKAMVMSLSSANESLKPSYFLDFCCDGGWIKQENCNWQTQHKKDINSMIVNSTIHKNVYRD
jgi:hypothetical protein